MINARLVSWGFALLLLLLPLVAQADMTTGRVWYGKFNENTGLTTEDSSVNDNHGTLTATTSWDTGHLGSAVVFDSSGDQVTVTDPGDGSVLDFATGTTISMAAWVYPTSVSSVRVFVCKTNAGNSRNYEFRQNAGKFEFVYRNDTNTAFHVWTSTNVVFPNTTWTHVVFVYTFATAGSPVLYINNGTQGGGWTTGAGNVAPLVSNDLFRVGQLGGDTQMWLGRVDELSLYNRALTSGDVGELFAFTDAAAPRKRVMVLE